MNAPIEKLLIANSGEIACRVMKTTKKLGKNNIFSDYNTVWIHKKEKLFLCDWP